LERQQCGGNQQWSFLWRIIDVEGGLAIRDRTFGRMNMRYRYSQLASTIGLLRRK
jgi:hypothetical protein